MADYNIYIHDLSQGSQVESQTKAWTSGQNNQTKAWKKNNESLSQQDNDSNGTVPVSAFKAVGSAIKSHPVVAAAVIAVGLAIKAVDTATPFISREGGDYRWETWWSNAKQAVQNMTRPFSTVHSLITSYQISENYNKKQEQNRLLLGDSFVNSRTRRI